MVTAEKSNFWRNKRILITGHSGFKGSWLTSYLYMKGAKISGVSLPATQHPSLFSSISNELDISSHFFDLTNQEKLKECIEDSKPEIIFHLAAQAIVHKARINPYETIKSNTLGTTSLLDLLSKSDFEIKAIINVTTDKVYTNKEWVWGYRENDELGGDEIYSISKASADLVAQYYSKNHFGNEQAIMRAGNVIGGGDWSEYRLIPDIVRAWQQGSPLALRNPKATRPWQHVIEPIIAYTDIAREIYQGNSQLATTWNIGPNATDCVSVMELSNKAKKYFNIDFKFENEGHYEAGFLSLDCSKIKELTDWRPVLTLDETLDLTFDWYKQFYEQKSGLKLMEEQFNYYEQRSSQIKP